MMKKFSTYYLLTVLAGMMMCFSGCQNVAMTPDNYVNYPSTTFSVMLNGSAEYENTVSGELGSSEMVSADGKVAIPMSFKAKEGIETAGGAIVENEAQTKGNQINTSSEDTPLADFIGITGTAFQVVAFNGDNSRFIPETSEAGKYAWVDYEQNDWRIRGGKEYSWKDSESKTFYAYMNLPEADASVDYATAAGETLTYTTVPAEARAQKDILLGFYQGKPVYDDSKRHGGVAELTFFHPMTAVKFVKGEFTGMTDVKFKSISLSNTYQGGTAALTPDSAHAKDPGDKVSWTPGAEKQTVTLSPEEGQTYLDVDETTGVIGGADGTFLLIPQSLVDEPVNITVLAEIDGVVVSLVATRDKNQWKAGYTNIYTLGFDKAVYNLTVDGEVETEYTGGTATYSVTSSMPWKLQYKLGDEDWADAVAGEAIVTADNEFVSFDVVAGEASDTPTAVTATVREASQKGKVVVNHIEIMKSRTPLGSKSRPWDLSMHDIFGHSNGAGKANTANSYIISAAGWYAFPMVYGNAIKNGELNKSAYHNTGASLNNFIKADGAAIPEDAPYLEGAASVSVLWEDADLITRTSDCLFIVPFYEAANYGLNGCDCDYVVFRTNMDALVPGNALIVVKDGSGTVLWSWHIWVTDSDLTPVKVRNSDGSFDGGMMPLNLGWVDENAANEYNGYPKQALNVRFVQMNGSEIIKEVVKTVIRNEYVDWSFVPAGHSIYYQWGRKDPLIEKKVLWYGNNSRNYQKTQGTIQTAILNPATVMGYGTNQWRWYSGSQLFNLWDAFNNHNTGNYYNDYNFAFGDNKSPVKTVYDPCPPGYQVPQGNVFTGFTNGTWTNSGRSFSTGYGETLFFPAAGYYDCLSSSISDYTTNVGKIGIYFTATNPDYYGYKYSLWFDNENVDLMTISTAHHEGNYVGNAKPIRPVQDPSVIH